MVFAKLIYFLPPTDGSRPYTNTNIDPSTGERGKNWVQEEHTVEIEDLRGKEDSVTLDTAGFQFAKKATKHKSFTNDDDIKKEYYPESIELIQELTGASKVVLFDHTIRRNRPSDTEDTPEKRRPVSQVHVDQTPAAAEARVHRHMPASEVKSLLEHRYQIINLWRPINNPALDFPLAMCNYASVNAEKDLVPVRLLYPDREGETFGVKYSPEHRWKYVRGLTTDEVVLIKCFDSVQDGSVAVFTPHTGFQDPTTPKDAPLRQSIELRALVFYD